MFVPVACSQCGKPFQVPEAAVGKPTVCPWCQATVAALPVGSPPSPAENKGPTPAARPDAPEPLPLPLDDAPAAIPRSRRSRLWMLAVGVVALMLACGATIAVLRYKHGDLMAMEWKTFTAPDGSCSVELLGKPTEETGTEANEKRFVAEGWYSGTTTWLGWRDLNAVQVQNATAKEGWVHLLPLFETERERWKGKFGATVTREGTRFEGNSIIHEVRMVYPSGFLIERMIVMPGGTRPRVYFVGMAGRINPDGSEVKRLFDSLHVFE